jgi:hypothetical protein
MLNNLKMRTKLLILSVPLMILICMVGFIGYYSNGKANSQMDEMYKKRLIPISWLIDARNQARANDADVLKLITYSNTSNTIKMDDVIKDVNSRLANIDSIIANYEKMDQDSYEKDILAMSIEKGGSSVLADAYLINGTLTEKEATFFFGYGVLLQICDDLQDGKKDLQEQHMGLQEFLQ